jgi:hypothetical protein
VVCNYSLSSLSVEKRKGYKTLVEKAERKYTEDLGVDVRMTSKCMLGKLGWRV